MGLVFLVYIENVDFYIKNYKVKGNYLRNCLLLDFSKIKL